jgi:hypothetical protein
MARLPEAAHMLNMIVVVLVALGVLSVASRSTRFREISIVAMLFLLHPAVLKSGTTAFADAYAILAVFTATSLIASASDDESLSRAAFVAGLVSWIGIQSRYQLVAFGVAASLGFLFVWRSTRSSAGNLGRFALGAIAAGAMASPFYLMNLSVFGNPVWPFFAHTGANASYADLVGAAYHHSQTGAHSIAELMRGLGRLVTFRDMFPIPLVFALVGIAAWIRCKRERATLIIATSFALLWIIAQPALFPRFVLYLVPFVLLLAICLINSARGSSKIRVGFMTAALVLFAAADTVYSTDNLKYDLTGDTAAFHRYTWYFPVYQWVNSHAERDARFLVIVWSGYTYHLDRQYRRADPWLSGEMDWRRIQDARALDSAMTRGKFDYVIYDARSWKGMEGGENMMLAMDDAIRTGSLIPVRKFRERLYTSRINKSYHESDVYVLRRKGG